MKPEKYIPIEKQSKRNQKAYHAQQRKTWGAFSPVTQVVKNGKAYNRKKSKQEWKKEHRPSLDFLFMRPKLF